MVHERVTRDSSASKKETTKKLENKPGGGGDLEFGVVTVQVVNVINVIKLCLVLHSGRLWPYPQTLDTGLEK